MSTNLNDAPDREFATAGACPTCGFTPERMTPEAAALALQDLPQRWRGALTLHLDDLDPVAPVTGRLASGGWSALEHAGHVRDVVHALDIRLQRVLREDEPVLPETHATPPSGANEQGVAVVLAALAVSTDQLSATIEWTADDVWSRQGFRRGVPVSALDLAREAVHEGDHHLALATRTIYELRSTSAASSTSSVR